MLLLQESSSVQDIAHLGQVSGERERGGDSGAAMSELMSNLPLILRWSISYLVSPQSHMSLTLPAYT